MNIQMIKSVTIRFGKIFLAGGLAAGGALLLSGLSTVKDLDSAKHLGLIVATAFIAGGLAAIEKALNWQAPQPTA